MSLRELQRAGADLGGHAHAGLAAVRLERLHEGQEPLRVVDLELEVRHGALAHGPLELGRVHVGVRVPELVGVHAAAAGVSFTTFSVLSCLRSLCLSSMKPAMKGCRRSGRPCAASRPWRPARP